MLALRKILVVIEPDHDTQLALNKAIRLARCSGATLELLICDDDSAFTAAGNKAADIADLRARHTERQCQLLEDMADVIRRQGFEVKVDALWGSPPYRTVVEKVLASQPDLLVHSTHPRDKLSRLLLSHQDWQLLRYCPCPLLLVKDTPWRRKPVVVVAVDPVHANDKPAELDWRLTAAGARLAEELEGDVHLFHSSYRTTPANRQSGAPDVARYRELTESLLDEFDIPDEQLHISGVDIQRALPALLAEVNASVLVMGAVSRSAIDRFLVGSTAEKLLDRVEQDVLIIKPEGFTDTVKKATPESL